MYVYNRVGVGGEYKSRKVYPIPNIIEFKNSDFIKVRIGRVSLGYEKNSSLLIVTLNEWLFFLRLIITI